MLVGYALLGMVLWPFPVLNILHVESSAVVAFVAFFAAGVSSLYLFDLEYPAGRILAAQEMALVVPWVLLTFSLLWAPNCGYLHGLLFYVLFPVVSVVLAVALAFALSETRFRRKGLVLVVVGTAVSVLGPVYDVGLHPQFYTYNHVFGGVLGPIYDEELAVRPGLFAFRGLTLLWALLLFQLGTRLRQWGRAEETGAGTSEVRSAPWWARWPAVLCVVFAVGLCYLFSARLGLNTPGWYIQEQLGGYHRTEHFDIYYDPDEVTDRELFFVALDHEYHYHRLVDILGVQVNERIRSYLYPDADVKAQLTGARFTNVAPTWLPDPQTHVLASRYEEVFPHELAHVFSREFGLPGLRATLSVGMVEGLAVALEPPDGLPSPHDQVLAAVLLAGRQRVPELVADVAARLSPLGFWTGRGAVSYTTTGSFVRYLLDAYGSEPLKRVYAYGNFEDVYGKPLTQLVDEWQAFLFSRPVVAQNSAALVLRRFTVPSLFEVECPHYVPDYLEHYRMGVEALEREDSTAAFDAFTSALEEAPTFAPALTEWSRFVLARDGAGQVVQRLSSLPPDVFVPALDAVLGDAYAVLEDSARARMHYDRARARLVGDPEGAQTVLLLRKAVAGSPQVIRILTSAQPPELKARELSHLEGDEDVLRFLRALVLAMAHDYPSAVRLLAATSVADPVSLSPAGRRLLERQRLEWLARFSYRAGAFDAAEQQAVRAARAYRALGDFSKAAALEAFAKEVVWAQRAWQASTHHPTPQANVFASGSF